MRYNEREVIEFLVDEVIEKMEDLMEKGKGRYLSVQEICEIVEDLHERIKSDEDLAKEVYKEIEKRRGS